MSIVIWRVSTSSWRTRRDELVESPGDTRLVRNRMPMRILFVKESGLSDSFLSTVGVNLKQSGSRPLPEYRGGMHTCLASIAGTSCRGAPRESAGSSCASGTRPPGRHSRPSAHSPCRTRLLESCGVHAPVVAMAAYRMAGVRGRTALPVRARPRGAWRRCVARSRRPGGRSRCDG